MDYFFRLLYFIFFYSLQSYHDPCYYFYHYHFNLKHHFHHSISELLSKHLPFFPRIIYSNLLNLLPKNRLGNHPKFCSTLPQFTKRNLTYSYHQNRINLVNNQLITNLQNYFFLNSYFIRNRIILTYLFRTFHHLLKIN